MLRGPVPESEIQTADQVRTQGMGIFETMTQQLFTAAAPQYVNFLFQKEQAALAAAQAEAAANKPAKGGKKKKGKGKKKKGKGKKKKK